MNVFIFSSKNYHTKNFIFSLLFWHLIKETPKKTINFIFILFFSSHDAICRISRLKEERMARLANIDANRVDRQNRRRQHRQIQTQNFLLSLHMLQANNYLRESGDENSPFEDYSIYMYRQNAPEFTDRVKELENKLLYPVSGN